MVKKCCLLFVLVLILSLSWSCSKKSAPAKTETDPSGSPSVETTVNPNEVLKPTPVTGEKADKDPASIAVKDYFFAIRAGDYQKAYQLTTGEFRKKKGSLEEFSAPFQQAAKNGRIYDKVTVLGVNTSESGMEKIVTINLTIFENQQAMTLNGVYVVIQQKDKTWKIADNLTQ